MLLDAFAVGVLPRITEVAERLAGRLVLTPNPKEAALLLGVEEIDDRTRRASPPGGRPPRPRPST